MTKNIKKYLKSTSYGMLTACTVIFGFSSEVNASDIVEKGTNFIRTIKYGVEDIETEIERATRQQPNDPVEKVLQKVEDKREDFWKMTSPHHTRY